jgi:hypothetical protein
LAQALAGDLPALNALAGLVEKLMRKPNDPTAAVLALNGSLAPLKTSAGGLGVLFLEGLGYALKSGFYVLTTPNRAKLEGAQAAIQRAMCDESYLVVRKRLRLFHCVRPRYIFGSV